MAEPTVTFGSAEGFGDLTSTGWVAQNNDSNVNSERASVLDKDGNEEVSATYSEKTDVTSNYAANTASAVTVPASIGALVNSLILTGISISTAADNFVTLALTGHNHTANAHDGTPALKTAAHGMSVTAGFGAQDFLGGTAGSNADVVSSTLNITCQHKDEDAADGTHLVGENYNAMIESTSEWVGVPTTPADTSTWDEISVVTRTDNQGFLRTTVTGTKKVDMA